MDVAVLLCCKDAASVKQMVLLTFAKTKVSYFLRKPITIHHLK